MSDQPEEFGPRMAEVEPESDFGSGIVVCLAKFSEHLSGHGASPMQNERLIRKVAEAQSMNEIRQLRRDGHYISDYEFDQPGVLFEEARDASVSHSIEMWMNAASDHFYDLDEKAPVPLQELASLTLRIGHGFTGETWTTETIDEIRRLWRESCIAVDAMLGVEEPDWGKW
jgi:hypothetical protein